MVDLFTASEQKQAESMKIVDGGFNQLVGANTARILAVCPRMRSAAPSTVDTILVAWCG